MTVTIFDTLSNYYDNHSLFVGSHNVELLVDTMIDIRDAVEWRIHVRIPMPDLINELPYTEVIWLGTPYNKQFIRYMIQQSDLPVAGIYKLFSFVRWTEQEIPGEVVMLPVKLIGE